MRKNSLAGKTTIILLIISFSIMGYCQAQNKTINPNLNDKEDSYLNRQANAFLTEISNTLNQFPPQFPRQPERIQALSLLDAVMHDKYAAFRPPVQHFYQTRILNALQEIEKSKIKNGAKIWKLYNMGFIVKTKSVTIAFDLVSGESAGSEKFTIPNDIMGRFVDQCDVLFISHRHRDHKDYWIAQKFIEQGKPVVAPPQVWNDNPIHDKITLLKREANKKQSLYLPNKKLKLDVVVYPGHQMSSHENNVSLVFTPENLSFCHMGDQINEGDFMIDYEWIDHVSEYYEVDVLMPPCWTNEIYRIVKGFDPKLVIPGHENELGHSIDDRVPFWDDSAYLELTYPELKKSNYPLILMTWGESYHYLPNN